jgi:hypothetical protein
MNMKEKVLLEERYEKFRKIGRDKWLI